MPLFLYLEQKEDFFMKVYELSKELNIPNKELVQFIQSLGIDVKHHLGVISDEDVDRIKSALAKQDKVVKPKKEMETKKTETTKQWKPDLKRMIRIKNIAQGKLIYVSKRQLGYTVEWPNSGDVNYLELGEFINLKNTDRRFVTEPWIRILEDDEVEILKYANIYQHYKGILGIDNITDMLKEDFESFKKKFDNLPKGFKNTVAEHAARMIKAGELDSIKIKDYIEEEMEIELELPTRGD